MAAATSTLCQKCSLVLTNFNTFLLFFNFCFKGLRSNRCCDAAFLRSNRCCDAAILRSNRCCGAAFLRRKCVRLAATLPPVRRKHDRDAATLPPVRCKRVCNAATVCRLCVANAVATQRLCLTGTLTDPLSWFAITLLRTNKPETRRIHLVDRSNQSNSICKLQF